MRAALLLAVGLAGCADDGTGDGTIVPLTTTPTPTFTLSADLVALPEHAYVYDASWGFANIQVAAGEDWVVSWDGLTADAWGEVRDPASYDRLLLMSWALDEPALEQGLGADDIDAASQRVFSLDAAGRTSARMSDLADGGSPLDPATELVEDPARTLLLALVDDAGPRVDLRDGVVVVPLATSSGTLFSIPNGGASHEATIRIEGAPIRTDEGHPEYTIDWSALVTSAYGVPLDPARADELFVGRFEGVDEPDDLVGDLYALDAAATGFWTGPSGGGTSASLSGLKDAGGASFPGFTEGPVWLVGARCTTCLGPAPQWMVAVEARQP